MKIAAAISLTLVSTKLNASMPTSLTSRAIKCAVLAAGAQGSTQITSTQWASQTTSPSTTGETASSTQYLMTAAQGAPGSIRYGVMSKLTITISKELH